MQERIYLAVIKRKF